MMMALTDCRSYTPCATHSVYTSAMYIITSATNAKQLEPNE